MFAEMTSLSKLKDGWNSLCCRIIMREFKINISPHLKILILGGHYGLGWSHKYAKDFIQNTQKNSYNSTIRIWTTRLKWAKYLNRHLIIENIQMENKNTVRFSTSYLREFKIKIRSCYTPIKMAKIQNTENAKCWQECGATRTLSHC